MPATSKRLEALGVHAVLVATAIHDGTLDRAALARGAAARLSVAGRPGRPRYFGENGCLTVLRFCTTSCGVGSPATARWIDSLTAW